jgi:hypothetical protein
VKLNRWSAFPPAVKAHLFQRLRDRQITSDDLDKLRIRVESAPELPGGRWYKDFGSFKIVGEGPYPLTFLDSSQVAFGQEILSEEEAASASDE